jgi:methionyl-tRNA formyltransferase
MRYVFFGTPEASKIVLEELVSAGHIPVAVVTNPDRPVGRKQALTAPPVKQYVDMRNEKGEMKVEILQPEKPSSLASHLSSLAPDVFVVAFYGKLIPGSILAIPGAGTLGVHPSLLPLYRGPSPVQTAILDGAKEVGMTLYRMDEKMDEGPIVAQEKLTEFRPGEKDNIALWHELAKLGGRMASRILEDFSSGKLAGTPQEHSRATYTKKFSTEDAFVSEEDLESAKRGENITLTQAVHQKILAFTPEPGAWTLENGKRLKLLQSKIEGAQLVLQKIQYEGKKPLIL